ncbi:MAG: hypothetical protein LBK58_12480 [Prevotellaceae bacterium]|jgi:hypothetical protein|nr:hypothetical protein [Prevotellaceae bacterium]
MGRYNKKYLEMNTQILVKAKQDIPLYFNEFQSFWNKTLKNYSDDDLHDCYHNTLIFKNWQIAFNHIKIVQLGTILSELHQDINSSFYLSHFGQYRSAHMHLRSVIELSLQILYFYQHEVEFSQWKEGEFRIKHDELTTYLKKHPNIVNTTGINLIDEITKKWKEFSKYIHAEAPTYFQTNLQSSQTNQFIVKDFGIFKSNFLKTGYKINKLFLLFFREKINLFPTQQKDILINNMKPDDLTELGFSTI